MSNQRPDNRRFSSPAVLQNNGPIGSTTTPFQPERIELGKYPAEDLLRPAGRTYSNRQTQKALPKRPLSHLSPVQEDFGTPQVQQRSQVNQPSEDGRISRWSRYSRRISKQLGPSDRQDERLTARWSQMSKRLSRPLSFNGSVWLKQPEDFVLQFQFSETGSGTEYFDPPHHVFDRKKKKRLVYLVSLAAMFSPLSSNIYFPALDTIAKVLPSSESSPN